MKIDTQKTPMLKKLRKEVKPHTIKGEDTSFLGKLLAEYNAVVQERNQLKEKVDELTLL